MKEEVKEILNKLSLIYNKGWNTYNLPSLFKEDSSRFDNFHVHLEDEFELLFDYSKNHITKETLDLLLSLSDAAELPEQLTTCLKVKKLISLKIELFFTSLSATLTGTSFISPLLFSK